MSVAVNNSGSLQYPYQFVQQGWTFSNGVANTAITQAELAAYRLASFKIAPITPNVSFADIPIGGTFVPPPAPTVPDISLTPPAIPTYSGFEAPTTINIAPAPSSPDFSGLANISPPASQPGAFTAVAPSAPVVNNNIVVPAPPDLVLPDTPTLFGLNLPAAPNITIPLFESTPPAFIATPPANLFEFTEQPYSSEVLTTVQNQILAILNGGLGLPPDVQQQLYDEARGREDVNALRALQEAKAEFSALGWSEPSGVLSQKLAEVRAKNQNAQSELSRKVYTTNAQLFVENLKFALSQGIACEQLTIGLHNAIMDRAMRASQITSQLEIELFNAKVSVFNAQIKAFEADAEAFRTQLAAATTELQVYRAEIDAQAAIGQLNNTMVQAYVAQVQAVAVNADLYKTTVESVQAQVQVNTQIIEGYRAEVGAYAAQVGAYTAQWEGYRAQLQAYVERLRSYEVAAQVYQTRVSAWQTTANVAIEEERAALAVQETGIRAYTAQLEGVRAEIAGLVAQVQAQSASASAQATIYEASAKVAEVASDTQQRAAQLAIQRENMSATIALENARIEVTNVIQTASLLLEAIKGQAQVFTQLGASAMSAVNLGANISASALNYFSESIGFNYNGATAGSASP